ncbi:PQQ-binding-like beta-propeller repeat protein [Saliphagus infecundisoli]|uniref:PQQ-binding-like beta-propeller repeat protein n=1 Tax=Saliphagus infecundisoli TaxID=1849069 RepID=A0ABD5QK81_9EURY|nr:PQQ-binding-like beta-propeller repeat protein [Saliphagus infecundisoli]
MLVVEEGEHVSGIVTHRLPFSVDRRTLLATGTTLAAGGLFGSLPAAADEHGEGGDDNALEEPTGVAWRYDGSHDVDATVAAGGRIYTLADGGVVAIDAEDGSLVWETGDIGAERTLAVAEGSVFVAGDPVQALDAESGEVRWEGEIASQEMAVGHGMVYASSEGNVYALSGADGSVQWSRESATVETDDGERAAAELVLGDVGEDAVYAADSDEHLIVGFDPTTGETATTIAQNQPADLLTAGSGHVASYPAHDTAFLIEVATETRTDVPQSVAHTIVGDTYFTTTRNGGLVAFDLSDTAERAWELGTGLGTEHDLPAVVGGTAVTTHVPRPADMPDEEDNEDRVVALDVASGEEQWRYVFEGTDGVELADADGDTVYVSRNGELLALRPEEESGDDGGSEDDEQGDEPEEHEIPGEAEVIGYEDTEHVDVTHDFPSQSIGERACRLDVGVINTSEDRELKVRYAASTYDADDDHIDTVTSGTVVLEPGDDTDAEFAIGCEEDGSYEVSVDVMHSTEYNPDDGDNPADDQDDTDDDDDDEIEDDEDTGENDQEDGPPLELSVSAPDSIARGETASVDVRIWNHGEDAAEITVSLEAGDVSDSMTVEIAPGDCYASFHTVPCGDLSLGDNEWTITAGEVTESGTLVLTDS